MLNYQRAEILLDDMQVQNLYQQTAVSLLQISCVPIHFSSIPLFFSVSPPIILTSTINSPKWISSLTICLTELRYINSRQKERWPLEFHCMLSR